MRPTSSLLPDTAGTRAGRWLVTLALVAATIGCTSTPLGSTRREPAPLEAGRPASPPPVARRPVPPPVTASPGPANSASAPAITLPQPLRTSPLLPAAPAAAAASAPLLPPVRTSPVAPGSAPLLAQPPSGPAQPGQLTGAAAAPTAATDALPYNAAVAARFPEPANRSSAILSAGRTAFTSAGEMQALLRGWVRQADPVGGGVTVRLLPIGVSQAGIPIEGLLFTRSRDGDLEAMVADRRPTVVLVGQQRSDSPAAAEGLLVVAEQLSRGPLQPVLDRINVVVVPRLAADAVPTAGGHAGAVERDHLLLRTPEARALAQLVRNLRAAVVVDFEEYPVTGRLVQRFGAWPRVDVQLQHAMTANLPEFLTRAAEEWFREPLVAALDREQLSSDWHHRPVGDGDDRRLAMGSPRPESLRNVSGLKNAIGLLVESRGGDLGRGHLLRRVHTQVVAASSVLNSTAQRAADLVKLRQYLDNEVSSLACRGRMVLDAQPTPSEYTVGMIDPQSGAEREIGVVWDSALALQAGRTRTRPCGYWIAADQIEAVQRLRDFGLQVMQLSEAGQMTGERYRDGAERSGGEAPLVEAVDTSAPRVTLVAGALDVSPGSYYLPLAQPLANLAIAALEPDTPYGYLAQRLVSRLAGVARVTAAPDPRLFPAVN